MYVRLILSIRMITVLPFLLFKSCAVYHKRDYMPTIVHI